MLGGPKEVWQFYITMPLYPKSPFKHNDEIQSAMKQDFYRLIDPLIDSSVKGKIEDTLNRICPWLCTTPKITTFRVNDMLTNAKNVAERIAEELEKSGGPFKILTNPNIPELLVVSNSNLSTLSDFNSFVISKSFSETNHDFPTDCNLSDLIYDHSSDCTRNLLKPVEKEIIVDAVCGVAVLRGAHVFAPGIMGIPHGLEFDDVVSVYADLTGECKKGFMKPYKDPHKVYLGNGILKTTRNKLYGPDGKVVSGIGVYMTDIVSHLPIVSESILPKGYALLQNLPSIICSRILNPQYGEIILDMCAAPGNKTTHIAALLKGHGRIIALEKIKSKVERMKIQCKQFSAENVQVFCFDSTKAVCEGDSVSLDTGPPYNEKSFDRILLDVPCSALGQRPQLINTIKVVELESYVPLQRKLFSAAVRLLKVGGQMVYSTCTVTVGENEGMIAWALRKYPCLELKSVREQLCHMNLSTIGGPGFHVKGLTLDQSNALCRFGPEGDTVGFFIACFVKINEA